MELALQSTQCMAKAYGVQAEIFQRRSLKKEKSLCRLELLSNVKQEKVKKLGENVKELDEMLGICKRRITEQNESNSRLREQVSKIDTKT